MPKIKKVVATVWYNKKNMHDLRRVFPDAEFCYVDFFDKEKLEKEVKDADVAILMGDAGLLPHQRTAACTGKLHMGCGRHEYLARSVWPHRGNRRHGQQWPDVGRPPSCVRHEHCGLR